MRAPSTLITALALALAAGASLAQVSDQPPALPAATQLPAPTSAPAAVRKPIDLPAARPADPAVAVQPADDGLVPTAAEMAAARQNPTPAPDPETRIEEVVRGKQVVEVVVTPGLTQRSYVMENRPERAAAPGAEGGTLSVPRFLRFDF